VARRRSNDGVSIDIREEAFAKGTYDVGTRKERLVLAIVLALELRPVLQLNRSVLTSRYILKSIKLVALMSWIDIRGVRHDLIAEVGLRHWVCVAVSHDYHIYVGMCLLFPRASLNATCHASSAILNATEPCESGKIERFDGPSGLPHGAELS
jgi:hypothetical protein